jgi:Ca2+-binding RTX toxin-like protein
LAGTTPLVGTGNDLNNILSANVGGSTLVGGDGDDTYVIDNSADVITETSNAGIDTVQAPFTFTLTDANLENIVLIGVANVNATGNAGVNSLDGNTGNNLLDGAGGNDILRGGAGNDTLTGGAGIDTLTGGVGLDSFVFRSVTEGVDLISDFNPTDDTINISASGFGSGLTANTVLANAQFTIGTSATTGDQRFIYNPTTGALLFDADGNLPGNSQQIATLGLALTMTNNDIFLLP